MIHNHEVRGSIPRLATKLSYYTYILYSPTKDRYYIGSSEDPERRLIRHNAGATPSTKPGRPWEVVYTD